MKENARDWIQNLRDKMFRLVQIQSHALSLLRGKNLTLLLRAEDATLFTAALQYIWGGAY